MSRQAHPVAQRAEAAAGDDNTAYAKAARMYAAAFTSGAAAYAALMASAAADGDACHHALSGAYDGLSYVSGDAADLLGQEILTDLEWLRERVDSGDHPIPAEFFRRPLWSASQPGKLTERIVEAGGQPDFGLPPPSPGHAASGRAKPWWKVW